MNETRYYSFNRPLDYSWLHDANGQRINGTIEDGPGRPGPMSVLTCERLTAATVARLDLVPHVTDNELNDLVAAFRGECERRNADVLEIFERVGINDLLAEKVPWLRSRMVAGARYDRTFPALGDL